MQSDNARAGMQQAPARSLFNALGFTKEEMNKPPVYITVPAEAEEKEPEKTTSTVQVAKVEKIKDVTKIDDLVDVYGDELDMSDEELNNARFTAEGFTFEPVDKRMKVDYCYYLNVRVGPSTDFEIIRSVPVGTEVHVVARCVENGWYRIIANGKIVYQCGVYFSEL